MLATRACCAPLLAACPLRCRPAIRNLARHLERESRPPSRFLPPGPPRVSAVSLPSHRSLSISAPRHRAQYSRFDDDPNRPPTPWFQRRDVIMYTLGAGSVVYYIYHLEQVPETGRWRFMDMSPKSEAALWEASYSELSKEFQGRLLPPSHIVTQHIHRVISNILEANDLGTLRGDPRTPRPTRSVLRPSFGFGSSDGDDQSPDLWDPDAAGGRAVHGNSRREWNLLVVHEEKTVNAMAAPGTIVVFTGILPVAKDEQGLAAILGHEIGHVVARHAAERFSYAKIIIAIAFLAEAVGLPTGFGQILTKLLVDLPHSRKQEYEADKIGLKLSAKACFDPSAAPEMFKRLGALEKSAGALNVSFLNTHPASDERVKQLQALLPEAFTVRASACGGASDYLDDFVGTVGLR